MVIIALSTIGLIGVLSAFIGGRINCNVMLRNLIPTVVRGIFSFTKSPSLILFYHMHTQGWPVHGHATQLVR